MKSVRIATFLEISLPSCLHLRTCALLSFSKQAAPFLASQCFSSGFCNMCSCLSFKLHNQSLLSWKQLCCHPEYACLNSRTHPWGTLSKNFLAHPLCVNVFVWIHHFPDISLVGVIVCLLLHAVCSHWTNFLSNQ